MNEAVLDASAILALLNDEPGAEAVQAVLDSAVVGAVNLSEVVAKLADSGVPEGTIREALDELELRVVPFDQVQAYAAGFLRPATRSAGLSLGDRACLSLAERLGAPALTTDRRWSDLPVRAFVRPIR